LLVQRAALPMRTPLPHPPDPVSSRLLALIRLLLVQRAALPMRTPLPHPPDPVSSRPLKLIHLLQAPLSPLSLAFAAHAKRKMSEDWIAAVQEWNRLFLPVETTLAALCFP